MALQKLHNELHFEMKDNDSLTFRELTDEKREKIKAETLAIHSKKLDKLGIQPIVRLDASNITLRKKDKEKGVTLENRSTIVNKSDKVLNSVETEVLNKGLKFGIKNIKVDSYEMLTRFKVLAQTMNKFEIAEKGDELKVTAKCVFSTTPSNVNGIYRTVKKVNSLTDEQHTALKELAHDKTIVVTKADKGNTVVIQNVDDYRKKVLNILDDKSKFQMLDNDPTRKRETRLQGYLRSIKLAKETYKVIQPCGSRAGVLYGLPKIHKEGAPVRPIISAIGTYNYKLAKWLAGILTPLWKESPFMLKDTFEFVNKVKEINTDTDKFMLSFDVESLFTNVPTDETIEIILRKVFQPGVRQFHGMTREILKKFLVICTKESHFQFNRRFYEPIEGVAMGSPLGPLFANAFMSDFEEKHIGKLREMGLNIWLRYVDDVCNSEVKALKKKSCCILRVNIRTSGSQWSWKTVIACHS